MRLLLLSVWVGVLSPFAGAQLRDPFLDPRYVDSEQVFSSAQLARIDITMSEADYRELLDEPEEREDQPATMRFRNALLDETLTGVGVRFRGNSSIDLYKHSWNIDFNHFVEGQRFHGLRQFNLNSHHNDPSIFRGHLMLEFCRRQRIPAPRSHLCDLYLHTTGPGGRTRFLGTFVNAEQIDGTFLRAWYTDNDGPLYKCEAPADFRIRGNGSASAYEDSQYELADDDLGFGYAPLAAFIELLNTIPDSEFAERFPEFFDVPAYLRVLAVETLFGHYDNHWHNRNNCYLYVIPASGRPGSGKVQFITYDHDNTMGVCFDDGFNPATIDFRDFGPRSRSTRPLPARVLAVPAWEAEYLRTLDEWIRGPFTPAVLEDEITRYRDMIGPSIQQDISDRNYYGDQWGYTYDTFLRSIDNDGAVRGHVRQGLRQYVRLRSGYTMPEGLILF